MMVRIPFALALAAASSFAMAAAAQTPPQAPANAASSMTDAGDPNTMSAAAPSTSAEPSESTEPMTSAPPPRSSSAPRTQSALDAALQHVAVVCDTELRTYCASTPSGHGQVLSCLNSHRSDASSQCQTALDRVQASYSPSTSSSSRVHRHKVAMHHRAPHKKTVKRRT